MTEPIIWAHFLLTAEEIESFKPAAQAFVNLHRGAFGINLTPRVMLGVAESWSIEIIQRRDTDLTEISIAGRTFYRPKSALDSNLFCWIPTSERLPKHEQIVLVVGPERVMKVATYDATYKWFMMDTGTCDWDYATDWCPIPALPPQRKLVEMPHKAKIIMPEEKKIIKPT